MFRGKVVDGGNGGGGSSGDIREEVAASIKQMVKLANGLLGLVDDGKYFGAKTIDSVFERGESI